MQFDPKSTTTKVFFIDINNKYLKMVAKYSPHYAFMRICNLRRNFKKKTFFMYEAPIK